MPDGEPDCGPYNSKAGADEDRVGMTRFFRYHNETGYMTSGRVPQVEEPIEGGPLEIGEEI
jgi:hypothetical protein